MSDEQPNVQAEETKNENDSTRLTPVEIKALKELNKELGLREDAGDRQWFIDHTAPEFAFQRADGKTFDDRLTFLMKVAPKKPDASCRHTTKIKVIKTPNNKKRAIVSCIVTTDQGRFHNLRLFVRSDEKEKWQLLGWANEKIVPLPHVDTAKPPQT